MKKLLPVLIVFVLIYPAAAEDAYTEGIPAWDRYVKDMGGSVTDLGNIVEMEYVQDGETIRLEFPIQIPAHKTNIKLEDEYKDRPVFLVSDWSWRDILTFIPATVWVGDKAGREAAESDKDARRDMDWCHTVDFGTEKCAYPLLIYHTREGNHDLDGVLDFLERYKPGRIVHIGYMDDKVKGLLQDYGGVLSRIDEGDVFRYWRQWDEAVFVEDDYGLAMLAAQYASYINAPLVIEDRGIDQSRIFEGKKVIAIGKCPAGDRYKECTVWDQKRVQDEIIRLTASDKVVIVNPNDRLIDYCEDLSFITEAGGRFDKTYCGDSLAAAYLATAKEEVIVPVKLEESFKTNDVRYVSFSDIEYYEGEIYAIDSANERVWVLDATTGEAKKHWGKNGDGPGEFQFAFESGIAVGNGKVYVADRRNHRVQVFDAKTSDFIKMVGKENNERGDGPGEFDEPSDVELDESGKYLLVAERGNSRVQIFEVARLLADEEPKPVKILKKLHLNYPTRLDVSDGMVYVGSDFNRLALWVFHIQEILQSDDPQSVKGGFYADVEDGQSGTKSIATFGGEVYVADAANKLVQVFDKDGKPVRRWEGTSKWKLDRPEGIAAGQGRIYVSDGSIKVFDRNGNPLQIIGPEMGGPDPFKRPRIVVAGDRVYTLETQEDNNYNIVQVFDKEGGFIDSWGSQGALNGDFIEPKDIVLGGDGRIYISDFENDRVQVFDMDGRFVAGYGLATMQKQGYKMTINLKEPTGIAVSGGNIYVVDSKDKDIVVFNTKAEDSDEVFGKEYGFVRPTDLAVFDDKLYVLDAGAGKIKVLDLEGGMIGEWGDFDDPVSMGQNAIGSIYLADKGGRELKVFDSEGNLLKEFEETDLKGWGVRKIFDLAIDRSFMQATRLYVVDHLDYIEGLDLSKIVILDLSFDMKDAKPVDAWFRMDSKPDGAIETIRAAVREAMPIRPNYMTFVASPPAIQFMVKWDGKFREASLDRILSGLLGGAVHGRIFGVTTTDSSAYVARSVFASDIASEDEVGGMFVTGERVGVPYYLPDAKDILGDRFFCYIDDGAHIETRRPREPPLPGGKNYKLYGEDKRFDDICNEGGKPTKEDYRDYDLVKIHTHGLPWEWMGLGIDSSDLLDLKLKSSLFFAESCSNIDYYRTANLEPILGVAAIRAGAIGYTGVVEVAGNAGSHQGHENQVMAILGDERRMEQLNGIRAVGKVLTLPFAEEEDADRYEPFIAFLGDPTYVMPD